MPYLSGITFSLIAHLEAWYGSRQDKRSLCHSLRCRTKFLIASCYKVRRNFKLELSRKAVFELNESSIPYQDLAAFSRCASKCACSKIVLCGAIAASFLY